VVVKSNFWVLLCPLILWAGSSVASAQQSPTGAWANEANGDYLYTAGMGGVSDGTYLYTVGGYQNTYSYPHEYYGRVRRYDPINNVWSNVGFLSTGVNSGTVYGYQYHAGDYYNGRIYIFGGYNYFGTVGTSSYSGGYTTNIRYFDLSTLTITTVSATMPTTIYYHAAVTMGDRIYISGGVSSAATYVFNPANNTLANATAMPGYLYYHGMAAIPALGKVYALGGYGTSGYGGYCYEYTPGANDPAAGSWAQRNTMNTNTSGGGAAAPLYYTKAITLNNRIYATGYNAQTGVQNMCLEYNAFTNGWTQRANSSYGHYYGHAFGAINGKGYSYGGYPNYTYGEEFTPPDFGVPPDPPGNVAQTGSQAASSLQSQADSSQTDGWTNQQMVFSANVTDANAAQTVRFIVQVKPQSAQWTQAAQVTTLQTPLGAQGLKQLTYAIPADGGYDWRYRVEDSFANSYPPGPTDWVDAFGTFASQNTNSPDFRSDQVPPTDPVALAPHNMDTQVNSPIAGEVVLHWQESEDNGPVSGISYELQTALDGGFNQIEAQIFSTAGTSSYPVTLTVSRFDKFWRIRARDVGGNFSNWSAPLNFRVTYNDGLNHSAGDAKKACGMTVTAAPAFGGALLGLILLAGAGLRRVRRS
jgi:hypothetical protein